MPPNATPEQKLSAKQAAAALVLARGGTVSTAAMAAQSNSRTIKRWRAENRAFREAIAQARAEIWEQAIGKVVAGLDGAIAALTEIAGDSQQPASARVSAAKSLMDTAQRHLETAEMQQQVESLEEKIDAYREALR